LAAWQALAREPVVLDVTEVRSRLRQKMMNELAEEDLQDMHKEHGYASVRRLQELTKPLNEALKHIHPRAEIDVSDDKLVQSVLKTPGH
jgi:hypothetical protein